MHAKKFRSLWNHCIVFEKYSGNILKEDILGGISEIPGYGAIQHIHQNMVERLESMG